MARKSTVEHSTGGRGAATLWLELAVSVLALALALAAFATPQFTREIGDPVAGLPWGVRALCFGLVLAQPLWILAPTLAACGLLIRAGRRGWARFACVAASVPTFSWLGVDAIIRGLTGNSAREYLRFLGDENALAMGGGPALLVPLVSWTAAIALFVLASLWLAPRLGHALSRFVPGGAPAWAVALGAALVAGLAAPVLAARSTGQPLPVYRLSEALALPTPFVALEDVLAANSPEFLKHINRELRGLYPRYERRMGQAAARSRWARLPTAQRTNVVVIAIESLRNDALDPTWMPRLHRWSKRGLRLRRHYATTNSSHAGLFALLYGRSPLVYLSSLDARTPSSLCDSLRRAGYRTTMLSSDAMHWQRMHEYLGKLNFDEWIADQRERWYHRDARNLERLRELLTKTGQLVVIHLNATHFPYQYPPEFALHGPVARMSDLTYTALQLRNPKDEALRRSWLNRYRNSLAFLDDALGEALESIDLDRTLVVVTGDHGESFRDDGYWLHSSRLSDAQLRVPMVLAGPGIPLEERFELTSHLDVVPTLLSLLHAERTGPPGWHGRDLLDRSSPVPALLLANSSGSHLHLMLGRDRLHLEVDGNELRALSLVDENANFLTRPPADSAAPSQWIGALRERLERLSR